eukprot:g133.t1
MGQGAVKIPKKQMKQYKKWSHFDEDEIVALHTHFHKISSTNEDGDDNVIDKGEFAESIHMDEGPFLDRMFNIFDDDGDGTITFEEFLCGMSILCTKGNKEEKLKFSFTVYTAGRLHNSISEEDVITKDDLKQLLKYKKFATLDDELIDDIIEKTFEDFGAKDVITYQQYKDYVEKHPELLDNMTVNIQARIAHRKKRAAAEAAAKAAGGEQSTADTSAEKDKNLAEKQK